MIKVTGMRNGISLVEMMIAIILFGVISVIGFQYYKNFMNTDLSAKKARVASLMDQARQLSNAYDVYQAQVGTAPTDITDLNASNVMILSEIPPAVTEIGTSGWSIETNTDYTGSTVDDIAFSFPIDDATPATDDEEYCAVFNNMIDSDEDLTVSDGQDFGASEVVYAALGNAFCFGTGASKEIVILKEAN
ncbi:MAG: type IV pilin protein [Campylobacterota bacterium]